MHSLIQRTFRPAMLLFAALLLINNIGVQAAPLGPDYSKVRSGMLFLLGDEEAIDALVTRSRVRMQIAGAVADVQMVQDFRNTTDQWINGEYVFPLPSEAAVQTMTILIGDRRIEGRILERDEAESHFKVAQAEGRVAAVMRREQSNLFRASIANIAPGETVSVELNYYQIVSQHEAQFSLRLPMTLTPRYNPKYPQDDDSRFENPPQRADSGPDAPSFSFSATLRDGIPIATIRSESHTLTQHQNGDTYQVKLARDDEPMDRDFVLSWQTESGARPTASLFTRHDGDEQLAMLMLTPPARNVPTAAIAREIIFVIDTSGSMAGTSIKSAKTALRNALLNLEDTTRFNIIRFDDQAQAMATDPIIADKAGLASALAFIDDLQADGGTEMANALHLAFRSTGHKHLRQIVFLTDGSVSNERQLLQLIGRLRGEARVFPVAIGSAPNQHFLGLAAKVGRGTLTHISEGADIPERLAALNHQLATPAMTDIRISDLATGRQLTEFPSADLYQGQSLRELFVLPPETRELLVEGRIGTEQWRNVLKVDEAVQAPEGVRSLWASQRIAGLLEDQWMSSQPDKHRADITALSLRYNVLSPYTAFLAVESVVSRPADSPARDHHVPNLLPAGMESRQAMALPQGGLGISFRFLIALLLLCIAALLMHYPGRRYA